MANNTGVRKLGMISLILFFISDAQAVTPEKKVLSTIFENYNKDIRPVVYPQDAINVKFGIALVRLLEINTKEQYMTVNVWIRLGWKDAALKWNEAAFGNVSVLRVAPSMLWNPDIIFSNWRGGGNKIIKNTNALIYPSGEVIWVPPALFKSSCTIDITYFPFDQQVCIMKFGSESYNSRELKFSLYNDKHYADLSDYWKSDDWQIVEAPAIHNVYEAYNDEDVTFYLTFRRKMTTYVLMLMLCIFIIAIATAFCFVLPLDKAERLILISGCMVGTIMLLGHLKAKLPPTSLVYPQISQFLVAIICLNIFTLITTLASLHLKKVKKPVPNLLMKYIINPISKKKPKVNKKEVAPSTSLEEGTELNSMSKDKEESAAEVDSTKLWECFVTNLDRIWFILYVVIISVLIINIFEIKFRRPGIDEDKVIRQNTPV